MEKSEYILDKDGTLTVKRKAPNVTSNGLTKGKETFWGKIEDYYAGVEYKVTEKVYTFLDFEGCWVKTNHKGLVPYLRSKGFVEENKGGYSLCRQRCDRLIFVH